MSDSVVGVRFASLLAAARHEEQIRQWQRGGAMGPGDDDPVGTTSKASTPVTTETSGEVEKQLRSPERVTMLSDGVFAIVLTILVLELKVPKGLSHKSLGEAVHELRPTLIAWVISFLITGMYWVAHRDVFARVRAVNRDLVWLNLLFLLPCALIPFASSVLGEYQADSKAIDIYGVVLIAVSVMRLVLYGYVVRRPKLLWSGSIGGRSALGYLLISLPIIVYLIAMGVASASPTASLILYFSVPVVYFLAVTIARERGGRQSAAEDFS